MFSTEQWIGQVRSSGIDVAISTDIVGLLGDPFQAHLFWTSIFQDIGLNKNAVGVERMAWRFDDKPTSIPNTVGVHSQLGPSIDRTLFDSAIAFTSDQLIHPISTILRQLQSDKWDKPTYINVHQLQAIHTQTCTVLPLLVDQPQTLLGIENDATSGSYFDMLAQKRRFELNNIPVTTIFDCVHFLKEHGHLFFLDVASWEEMCIALEQCGNTLVHIPIGPQVNDSLPLEKITTAMWKRFSRAIKNMSSSLF